MQLRLTGDPHEWNLPEQLSSCETQKPKGCSPSLDENQLLTKRQWPSLLFEAMENIKLVLEAAGATLYDVVKCTVFMDNIEDYTAINAVYMEYWDGPPPARSAFGADGLALGALLEATQLFPKETLLGAIRQALSHKCALIPLNDDPKDDPADYATIDAPPYVFAGSGPWAGDFERALRDALENAGIEYLFAGRALGARREEAARHEQHVEPLAGGGHSGGRRQL